EGEIALRVPNKVKRPTGELYGSVGKRGDAVHAVRKFRSEGGRPDAVHQRIGNKVGNGRPAQVTRSNRSDPTVTAVLHKMELDLEIGDPPNPRSARVLRPVAEISTEIKVN
ncbi:MAG: hypothetical protein OK474_04245, partial [Thaumarchaeota archaeon]|nr:hypothetical protein [Nitrososphaerota archaeon]